MKIFKYTVENNKIVAPVNIQIIRMNHVDDGFYKGDFVWGIVDPKDKCIEQKIDYREYPYPEDTPEYDRCQLAVKEKQTVYLTGKPIYATDINGKLWIYNDYNEHKNYKIVFYKTGQYIDEPIDQLVYLGICRLWIMQELGLYTFLVKE